MKAILLANKKIFAIILAVLVVGGVATGAILSSGNDKESTGSGSSEAPSSGDVSFDGDLTQGIVTETSDNVMMSFYDFEKEEFSQKRFSNWASATTMVVFEKSYSDDLTVTEFVSEVECDNNYALDISDAADGSVVAYLTSEQEDVILHIAGKDGVVMANKNSGYIFWSNWAETSEHSKSLIKEIRFNGAFNTQNAETMECMFHACKSLEKINLSGFNTSKVKSMESMFELCIALPSLDLSSFDTSSVETFESMFETCKLFSELDVSGFNTGKATNMSNMFDACFGLTKLNVSGFNTSAVTNARAMFNECKALTSLDVSSFDVSNIDEMSFMFAYCESLKNLDLSNFKTTSATAMAGLFIGCKSLETLNVSNFDMSKVTDVGNMFNSCGALVELDLSGFNPVKLFESEYGLSYRRSVFEGCNKAAIKYDGKVYRYGISPDLYQLEDDFFGVVEDM